MINGIDLLFSVIGLVLLFVVWYYGEAYMNWSEWNHRRRRQRIHTRTRINEDLEREAYLEHLRLLFHVYTFTKTMNNIGTAFRQTTKSFETLKSQ